MPRFNGTASTIVEVSYENAEGDDEQSFVHSQAEVIADLLERAREGSLYVKDTRQVEVTAQGGDDSVTETVESYSPFRGGTFEGGEVESVQAGSHALKQAALVFEVSLNLTRTQRMTTTVNIAAEDEDEAGRIAEYNADNIFDNTSEYDWETEDYEVEVEEAIEDDSLDEDDADYSA